MKVNRGFTLIEILITLTIIGITTAVAVPNYSKYLMRAKINEVIKYAKSIQQVYQGYYVLNNDHPTALSQLNFTSYTNTLITNTTYTLATHAITVTLAPTTLDSTMSACQLLYIFTPTVSNDTLTWSCQLYNNNIAACERFSLSISPKECTIAP